MNQDETHPRSQKKLSEKILSISTSILLVLALLFCFSVVYQMQTKRFVSVFGCSVFRVITDSMEPEIPIGALIISKETPIEKIEVGDVICFRSLESYMNNSIVTHRVIGITEKNGEIALRTRGDSNNSEDGFYVTRYNLIGKVIYHTKEGSFITNAYAILTSGIGFFTLIVIPVIVITVFILHEYLAKIKKELQQMKEELQQNSSDDFNDLDNIHPNEGENNV